MRRNYKCACICEINAIFKFMVKYVTVSMIDLMSLYSV